MNPGGREYSDHANIYSKRMAGVTDLFNLLGVAGVKYNTEKGKEGTRLQSPAMAERSNATQRSPALFRAERICN